MHHIDPYRLPVGKIAALIDFQAAISGSKVLEECGLRRSGKRCVS